ncbi:MAG: hypothetical protein QOI26_1795, partial [Pseudonocardiales bacterium]|nr:hypothetical protein [Pseudonocardiales bacterium]
VGLTDNVTNATRTPFMTHISPNMPET